MQAFATPINTIVTTNFYTIKLGRLPSSVFYANKIEHWSNKLPHNLIYTLNQLTREKKISMVLRIASMQRGILIASVMLR